MATTVMLKDSEAELLEVARRELFFRGLGSLDEAMQKKVENEVRVERVSNLTKGAVIAIASLVLINALENGRKKVMADEKK